ncbi:hypothetical protein SAMN05519104_5414 [Rhizobiales bacterium GAS188]|nr:hypothetical protein SAMN05519104_5414 [Rhizobiales bacterium GAS188]
MISQEAWNTWLSVAAIVLIAGAALYVTYRIAKLTDPQLHDFEEVLGDWPALGTRASEDK